MNTHANTSTWEAEVHDIDGQKKNTVCVSIDRDGVPHPCSEESGEMEDIRDVRLIDSVHCSIH